MGLSIVGGTDQACPPFGTKQRGVFVSKVRLSKFFYDANKRVEIRVYFV